MAGGETRHLTRARAVRSFWAMARPRTDNLSAGDWARAALEVLAQGGIEAVAVERQIDAVVPMVRGHDVADVARPGHRRQVLLELLQARYLFSQPRRKFLFTQDAVTQINNL